MGGRLPCVVLLLAGGMGRRMRMSRPKQYVSVCGRPVLSYALSAFACHPLVESVHVVCAPEWAAFVAEMGRRVCGTKFGGTFRAGETGFESLCNGIEGLAAGGLPPETLVLTHDAVRPLVSQAVIGSCIATAEAFGNAVAAWSGNEALLETADGLLARGCRRREELCGAQTPQAFSLNVLSEAVREAGRLHLPPAQSLVTLMADLGRWPVALSRGEWVNFKLTRPEDFVLMRTLLRGGWRTSSGSDGDQVERTGNTRLPGLPETGL